MGFTGEKEPLLLNSNNQSVVITIPQDNSIIDVCRSSIKQCILYKGELKTIFVVSPNLVIEKYRVKNVKKGFLGVTRPSDEYPLGFSNSIPEEEYKSIIEKLRFINSIKIKAEVKTLNLQYADRNIQFKPSFVYHGKGAFTLTLKIYHPIFTSQSNNDDNSYCFMDKHQFEPTFGTLSRYSIIGVKNIYPNQLSPFISPNEYSSIVDSFNKYNRKRRILGNINIIVFILLFFPSIIGFIIALKYYVQTVYLAIFPPIFLISGVLAPFVFVLLNRMLKSKIKEMVTLANIEFSSRNIKVVNSNLDKGPPEMVRLYIYYPKNNKNNTIASTNVQQFQNNLYI